ncbi:hypothetical protein [Bradyrhizobium septentrionale]|uniref:Uncharacterized protein n=1 Tax=Bradyrhizobium septentrionale TaxID=1404411 RepID=A0A973W3V0_9BRAD|nr:hypothetical protein [Bradyrhizobium septentrionale]UGY15833.1 hypothetical protein HAP48_0046325 [Bradyrhizobium septentrionale]UGY24407.1 hypothetical protein HU675_0041960 [Bradyrhizobium septentrionale]
MKTWLFSFHKTVGNHPQFYSNVFNGQAWSGDVLVPGNEGISNTPAAVVFNSNLYLFYPRFQALYYKVYDGEVWTAEALVPNMAGVGAGLAAAVYDGLIYLIYSNPGSTNLMYKTYDGTTFGPEINASGTNHLISVAYQNVDTPAALVLGDTLYVFGRGPGADEPGNMNRFWYATFDRSTWRSNPVAGTEGLSNGPGAALCKNLIYLFFNDPTGLFFFKKFDGSSWGADLQVPDTPGNFGNAAPVVFNQTLYILHQGPNGQYLYKTTDGEDNWTSDAAVPNSAGMSCGPAAVTFSL